VYIFGVADVSVSPAKLSACASCYQGETVKRGGNDIASPIMADLISEVFDNQMLQHFNKIVIKPIHGILKAKLTIAPLASCSPPT
jgi:hypothetical protein